MDPTEKTAEKMRWSLQAVHRASLIIEASRYPRDIWMAIIRANMVSVALNIIHAMRDKQRAELRNGHAWQVRLIGMFADIADDMLDTALGIESSRSDPCASQ